MATAVARHATFPYRFLVVSDQASDRSLPFEVLPLPACAATLPVFGEEGGYPSSLPKLWLFSQEARCLAPRVLYLDADSIMTGDLAPLVAYEPAAPFVGMHLPAPGNLHGAMFRLDTGVLAAIWDAFELVTQTLGFARAYVRSDSQWMRQLGLAWAPAWPSRSMGIYLLKDLDGEEVPVPLPPDARIVHPTGKTKPWHP